MTDIERAVEKVQQVYFDVCDLLNGNSYKQIGYDNQQDFLLVVRDHLMQAEIYLTKENENA
jgi:hypothetical protein